MVGSSRRAAHSSGLSGCGVSRWAFTGQRKPNGSRPSLSHRWGVCGGTCTISNGSRVKTSRPTTARPWPRRAMMICGWVCFSRLEYPPGTSSKYRNSKSTGHAAGPASVNRVTPRHPIPRISPKLNLYACGSTPVHRKVAPSKENFFGADPTGLTAGSAPVSCIMILGLATPVQPQLPREFLPSDGALVDGHDRALGADHDCTWHGEDAKALRQRRFRSEEHTSELQSLAYLVCRLLLEKKKKVAQEVGDKQLDM